MTRMTPCNWAVVDCIGLYRIYWTVLDCAGLYRTYWTVLDSAGLDLTVQDCNGL